MLSNHVSVKFIAGLLRLCGLVLMSVAFSGAMAVEIQSVQTFKRSPYYTESIIQYPTGVVISEELINGPPTPPPGFDVQRQSVSSPIPEIAGASKSITVPGYSWVFGCSSVSGAMIAGFYDRSGWPNIYTGPANGGVAPPDNSSTVWPTWSDGSSTYPNLPIAASKQGVDGLGVRGSINDYWVKDTSTASDPYITGSWSQHTWGTAIGDYMKTSQSAYGNIDGSTVFYNFGDNTKLTCSTMVNYDTSIPGKKISDVDGTYGRKLFYEARGYTVTDCYNQPTDNKYPGGFSFLNYKAEIDANRPVMINLAGHTIVGLGYDDATNTVYLHDTWDYSNHSMTWGGSYSGMAMQSVSIVNLNPVSGGGMGVVTGISAQGKAGINNEQLFGTFTVSGDSKLILIRGLGPTLSDYGTPGAITNPQIKLTPSGSTTVLAENDDWGKAANADEIAGLKYNPKYPVESAILMTLPAGIYDVYMSPSPGTATGIGMMQVSPK